MLSTLLRSGSLSKLYSYVFLLGLFLLASLNTTLRAQEANDPDFKARLINLEGAVSDNFRFQATLKNNNSSSQIYALNMELPDGWRAQFTAMGSRVTALQVEGKSQQEISIQVFPAPSTKPGKYTLPLNAEGEGDHHVIDFQIDITGVYALTLTTPDGRVSNEVVSGSKRGSTLVVENTGSLPLKDIELSAQTPSSWEASFDPKNIATLAPGESKEVQLNIQVPDKAIAGDYMAELSAGSAQQNAKLSYRVTVVTSMLSGWLGVFIILVAVGLVFLLIRKYGRR